MQLEESQAANPDAGKFCLFFGQWRSLKILGSHDF